MAAGNDNCCIFVGFLNPNSINAFKISSGNLNSAHESISSGVKFDITNDVLSPSFGFLNFLAFVSVSLLWGTMEMSCFGFLSFLFFFRLLFSSPFVVDGVMFRHNSTVKPLLNLIFFFGTSVFSICGFMFSLFFRFVACLFWEKRVKILSLIVILYHY